jgi:hypothetical protein
MDEFFKILRHFLTRDLVFLIGGGAVVAAFLYRFNRLPQPRDHLAAYLLLAGISYVVGYALQDGSHIIHLVNITTPRELGCLGKCLYNSFTRDKNKKWTDIKIDFDFDKARAAITKKRDIAQFERIVTLKQVGTTGGPCALMAAGLLLWKWLTCTGPQEALFERDTAIAAFLLGLILLALGRIKAAQQAEFLARASPHNSQSPGSLTYWRGPIW